MGVVLVANIRGTHQVPGVAVMKRLWKSATAPTLRFAVVEGPVTMFYDFQETELAHVFR